VEAIQSSLTLLFVLFLDQPTAEHFAKTINKLKDKVTILFITHQVPKGLKVDDAVILGNQDKLFQIDKELMNEK
jgi:subfamily B ATP-binding cassette protein HlyB/CyaB